jgi:hypothetical protein
MMRVFAWSIPSGRSFTFATSRTWAEPGKKVTSRGRDHEVAGWKKRKITSAEIHFFAEIFLSVMCQTSRD